MESERLAQRPPATLGDLPLPPRTIHLTEFEAAVLAVIVVAWLQSELDAMKTRVLKITPVIAIATVILLIELLLPGTLPNPWGLILVLVSTTLSLAATFYVTVKAQPLFGFANLMRRMKKDDRT